MRGLFLRYDDPAVTPRAGVRLRLAGAAVAYDLIAPIRCEPLPADGERALRASLGPDPLRADADPQEAVRRLAATRAPVGAALLDQAVWAGVGNAWRAELLFLAGLDPNRRDVGPRAGRVLWDLAVRYLTLGRDAGQVISDPTAPDERWVYKRQACRRCGAPVWVWELAAAQPTPARSTSPEHERPISRRPDRKDMPPAPCVRGLCPAGRDWRTCCQRPCRYLSGHLERRACRPLIREVTQPGRNSHLVVFCEDYRSGRDDPRPRQ
ncbi:hypothetical protein JNW88_12885 [Micromonospora sp. ATA32]|nr:hypothetical protein [Micromonospora sp. ATA32]